MATQRDTTADFKQAQTYVGQPYIDGEYDCAHFFLKVQQEMFGRDVHLPIQRHAQGRLTQAAQICAVRDEVAVGINTPVHGCAALLVGPSERGELWHIGVVLQHRHEWWVLHNSRAMGVTLNKLRELTQSGQRLEGFYQWK